MDLLHHNFLNIKGHLFAGGLPVSWFSIKIFSAWCYLIFNVAMANAAQKMVTIQNLVTILLS